MYESNRFEFLLYTPNLALTYIQLYRSEGAVKTGTAMAVAVATSTCGSTPVEGSEMELGSRPPPPPPPPPSPDVLVWLEQLAGELCERVDNDCTTNGRCPTQMHVSTILKVMPCSSTEGRQGSCYYYLVVMIAAILTPTPLFVLHKVCFRCPPSLLANKAHGRGVRIRAPVLIMSRAQRWSSFGERSMARAACQLTRQDCF